MRAIEIFRLRRVRDKPRALAAMQAHAGLNADEARTVLNQAVGGGKPTLRLPGDAAARQCIAALLPAGFVARFAAAPGFDAQGRAEAAILAAVPHLPAAISDRAGALLLQGDWESALAVCLQGAQDAVRNAAQQGLQEAAIEVGVQLGWQGNG